MATFIPESDHDLHTEITRLAGHINAVEYRFLKLLAALVERDAWGGDGIRSPAHWLNYYCGIALGAAREKVRVAKCLKDLPRIDEAFRTGAISYSKVRAMTRSATPENEEHLLNVAQYGTAQHVESLVRKYRRARHLAAPKQDKTQHESREFTWHYDDDGMLVFQGRLTPEDGAAFLKAMNTFFHALESNQPAKNVSAETPQRCGCTLDSDGGHFPLSAATARRLACDTSLITVLEDANGEILNVGRKTRTVPPPIRRALTRRDRGCRFPGCCESRFVDAHHIQHWCDGGETRLDNLILLCRRHHRLLHQEGYGIVQDEGGDFVFLRPDGRPMPEALPRQFEEVEDSDEALVIEAEHDRLGIGIDSQTAVTAWQGEAMDYDTAVGVLMDLADRSSASEQ